MNNLELTMQRFFMYFTIWQCCGSGSDQINVNLQDQDQDPTPKVFTENCHQKVKNDKNVSAV